MPKQPRAETEAEIARILLDQWDPLLVREQPGTHDEYTGYAHDLYSLLARGASDMEIVRALHRAERDDLNHPELMSRDLSSLMRALREVESRM